MSWSSYFLITIFVTVTIALLCGVSTLVSRFLIRYLRLNKWIAFIASFYLIANLLFALGYLGIGDFGCSNNGRRTIHSYLPSSSEEVSMPPSHVNTLVNKITPFLKSKMASKIPDTMEVGQSAIAIVKVTQSLNDSILMRHVPKKDIPAFLIDTFSVSSRVAVILIDPSGAENFKIQPLNTETQVVDPKSSREWKWQITPLKGGDKNELDLRVSVSVLNEFGTSVEDIPIYQKTVYVKTTVAKTMINFFKENWQWAMGAFFIPLFLWGRSLYFKWKARSNNRRRPPVGFAP